MMRLLVPSACLLLTVALMGCPPGPKLDYTADQVKDIDDTKELMRYAYAVSKGIWPLEDKAALAEPDWALLAEVGAELEASGVVLGDKLGAERADAFRALSKQFADEGGKLRDAAKAKQAAEAKAAIKALGQVCYDCHKQFK